MEEKRVKRIMVSVPASYFGRKEIKGETALHVVKTILEAVPEEVRIRSYNKLEEVFKEVEKETRKLKGEIQGIFSKETNSSSTSSVSTEEEPVNKEREENKDENNNNGGFIQLTD